MNPYAPDDVLRFRDLVAVRPVLTFGVNCPGCGQRIAIASTAVDAEPLVECRRCERMFRVPRRSLRGGKAGDHE